eukprot:GHVN01043747.1.p1 GENE.GHVN01043747.1~~GHVN01043747.1.p1  ORF type:complete len:222 (-),score=27.54 GHVN01043747.1:253-822(-)
MDNAPATTFYESFKEEFGDKKVVDSPRPVNLHTEVNDKEYHQWLGREIKTNSALNNALSDRRLKDFLNEKEKHLIYASNYPGDERLVDDGLELDDNYRPSLGDVKLMEQFVEDVMDNAPATTFYESFKEKFGDNTSNITNTEYQEWLNTEIHPTFRMVLDDPSENAKFKRFVEEKRNVVNSLRSNLRKY